MKALYMRISDKGQNLARQERAGFDLVYVDKCSGGIPLRQRPAGSDLIADIMEGKINEVSVKEIKRLGRNTIDILTTLEFFEKHNVVIHVGDIGSSHIEGKKNPVFDLIVTVISKLAEMDRDNINELTQQGREIAKLKGVYKGRKEGTTISRDKNLEKYKVEIKIIRKHSDLSVKKLEKLTGRSRNLVTKLKKML